MRRNIFIALIVSLLGLVATAQVTPRNIQIKRVGEKVLINFTTDIAPKATKPNYKLTITPGIYAQSNEMELSPIVVETRRSKIVDYRNNIVNPNGAILASNGEQVNYTMTVPYQKWMHNAMFRLDMTSSGCCTDKVFPPLFRVNLKLVSDPIPVYSVRPQFSYIKPEAEVPKYRHESGSAYLEFQQGRSVLIPDFRNNNAELAKIRNSIELVRDEEGTKITNIALTGFCSPEASWAFNTQLAQERASVVRAYIKIQYGYGHDIVKISSVPEDWALLKKIVEKSSLPEREQILSIINSDADPDTKDYRLSQLPIYSYLMNDIYPQLRRVDYRINYMVRGFDLAQSKRVLETNAKNLSLNEMFVIANSYPEGSAEFNKVFFTAAMLFPDDAVANINAATNALSQGDLDSAQEYLNRIGEQGQISAYNNTMGLLQMARGNYEKAEDYLKTATAQGLPTAKANLDELYAKLANIKAIEEREKEL